MCTMWYVFGKSRSWEDTVGNAERYSYLASDFVLSFIVNEFQITYRGI